MDYLIIVLLSLLGAVIYRIRGSEVGTPHPTEQMAFCSILGVLMYLHGLPWQFVTVGYILSVAVTMRGHGNNMDLGTYTGTSKDEWYEFMIVRYKQTLGAYWYDVLGIGFSGLLITAVPGVLIAVVDPIGGLLIGCSGALKAPAYMIGWKMQPDFDKNEKLKFKWKKFELGNATNWGEFFTGLFIWGFCAKFLMEAVA